MTDLLKDYPVHTDIRVEWGHMDALGHVNNTVYFRYFEIARIDYGAKMGMYDRRASEKLGPILAQIECRFLRPVVYPDNLVIGTRITAIGGTEIFMEYSAYSTAQDKIVASGKSLAVYYDYNIGKRTEIPRDLIEMAETLEKRTLPRTE